MIQFITLHSAFCTALRKAWDSNPQTPEERATVFETVGLPVSLAFRDENFWQGDSDLNREDRFWRSAVCWLAYLPETFRMHAAGVEPAKPARRHLIYSQALLPSQPRMQNQFRCAKK